MRAVEGGGVGELQVLQRQSPEGLSWARRDAQEKKKIGERLRGFGPGRWQTQLLSAEAGTTWREAVCKENNGFRFPHANIKFPTEAAIGDSYWRSEGHRLGLSVYRKQQASWGYLVSC